MTVCRCTASTPSSWTACGFDIERAGREMPALTARPEWRRLSAVRTGRVVITDA